MGKSKSKNISKTQFFKFVRKGEWKTFVDSVIEKGSCVLNTKKISGYTLLSCATQYGDKEIVDYLMQNGANCNASNFDGSIPLHVAAKHKYKDLLELFAVSSECIDSRDDKGRTALHYVTELFQKDTKSPYPWLKSYCHKNLMPVSRYVEEENMELASFLLSPGADIDAEESYCHENLMPVSRYIEEEIMELASLLLRHGADIDAKDHGGNVPLLLAEKHACPGVVEMLITKGANVKYCKDDKWTMLHHASSRGWLRVVKLLVERKVDIDAANIRGDTALQLAVKRSHVEIAELLIESGADINGPWFHTTPLHYASRAGWLNVVKSLVEYKADINVSTSSGATPVMLAVKYMHRDIFDFLVKHGADLVGTTCEGNTILHFACCTGWSDVIQSFVDRGHDIDAETSAGETPLLIAARHFNKEMVDILIKSGANLPICKPNSILLVHYVCENNWVDVFQSLVDAGLDINTTYPDGRKLLTDLAANCKGFKIFDYLFETGDYDLDYSLDYKLFYLPNFVNDASTNDLTVLHYACYFGRLEMVLSLIRKGADVNVSNSAGKTPLYVAVRKENTKIVKQLLDAGANANVITLKGRSPLYVAVCMDNLEIVMHLIDAGADVNAKANGQTLLFEAVDMNCMEIATYLLKAGADCNVDNGYGSAFEHYVKYKSDLKELPIFIESGAYITNDIYDALMKNSHFKEEILKNVELCTQAILNKFNNFDLHQIYHVPFAVKNLPPIKGMKIGGDKYVAKCIESSVIQDIETNGFCNITKIRPIVLSLLSVEAFIKYHIKHQNN